MLAGTAASMYGQTRVAGAQKRDIAEAGKKYDEERGRQRGFTGENEKTVAGTLDLYSRPTQDAMAAKDVGARQANYVAPIADKNFVVGTPADYAPNGVVSAMNASTGNMERSKSIGQALAKAKLDAYGDTRTRSDIGSNDNAQKLSMVNRIAGQSAAAANQQQAVLPTKLKADEGAGATWAAIGDTLKAAAMMNSMAGANGMSSWFSKPSTLTAPSNWAGADYGARFSPPRSFG